MAERRSGERPRSRSSRGWVLWLGPALALTGAALTLLLDGERGLRPLHELWRQVQRSEQRVEGLQRERASLLRMAHELDSDPFRIEAVARDKLGMVRPNEVMVHLGGTRTGMD